MSSFERNGFTWRARMSSAISAEESSGSIAASTVALAVFALTAVRPGNAVTYGRSFATAWASKPRTR